MSDKPDWKDSPLWAKWVAQDGDGKWWWHSTKPSLEDDFEWFGSSRFRIAMESEESDLFRDTLEIRP